MKSENFDRYRIFADDVVSKEFFII